jgi:hypothetical protein
LDAERDRSQLGWLNELIRLMRVDPLTLVSQRTCLASQISRQSQPTRAKKNVGMPQRIERGDPCLK